MFQSTLPHKEWLQWQRKKLLTGRFNPHSHIRSDNEVETGDRKFSGFNPHSHIRSDGKALRDNCITLCFNPHSHIRSDMDIQQEASGQGVSIHTPT